MMSKRSENKLLSFLFKPVQRIVTPVYLIIVLLIVAPDFSIARDRMDDSTLVFTFLKPSIELEEAGTYFNVINIENISDESFEGTLVFGYPEGWALIGPRGYKFKLAPGEKTIFPIRIGIPKNAIGGISYLITANLQIKDNFYYRSAYVRIQEKTDWRMRIDQSSIYLSDYKPVGSFEIELENRGNSNELIRLAFDRGGLVRFQTFIEADSILFIDLPAYRDTSIRIDISQRKDMSYSEMRTLMQNWRSTSVYIQASTPDRTDYSGVRIIPLESAKYNDMPLRSSPLNLDMTLFNLLSYQRPKASVKLHGKVYFPESQQVQYSLGMYNLYFSPEMYENIDLYQMLRYMVRYNDPKTQVWLGDRLGTGNLHTMSGRGLRAQHTLQDNYTFYFNLIHNPYGGNMGAFAGFSTLLGRVAVNTGVTGERTNRGDNKFYSLHLGGQYRFLRHHSIRLQTIATINRFTEGRYLQNDTTAIGFAYQLGYNYTNRDLNIRLNNTNTSLNYLRNAGINRIDADVRYNINNRMRLYGMFYHYGYSGSRYPYNFYYPDNRNINDNGRILFSYTRGNIIYQAGPQFFNTIRNNFNPGTGVSTRYENFQPGIITSVTFNLDQFRSITPNFSFNTMYFNFSTNEPEREPYSIKGQWQYTVGLNYYDQAFKLNAYYTSGEASDIYRSVVIEEDPQVNQAIHFRPYYERYLKNETIRLSSYLNYSYYMPSQRENTILNVGGDFQLKSGWNLFTSFNFYLTSRNDPDMGRVSTRDLNLMAGFRKAFDIQQPRLKYYDLTILGFNDQNGNSIKDDNEKPISNVLINIARDPDKNEKQKTGFSETQMITDPNGEIYYGNIPEGTYDLMITPLSNLEDLYFLDGRNQTLEANEDRIHYLPLVESYKVKGKVIIDRDPNSNEGRLNLEGIRITAESDNGDTYSALTTASGQYALNLPKSNLYIVKIYNVFGERFLLEQGEYEVRFMDSKVINIDFKFVEQRRQIRFNEENQLFDFNINRGD